VHVSTCWSVYDGGLKDAKPRPDAPKSVNLSIARRSKSHTMNAKYDCWCLILAESQSSARILLNSEAPRLVRIWVGWTGVELDHTESLTASTESQSMHETIMNNINDTIDLGLSRPSRRYYYLHT
jgi:hypothetical protein